MKNCGIVTLMTTPGTGKKQLLIGQNGVPPCEIQKHQQNGGEETPMKPDIIHDMKDQPWHHFGAAAVNDSAKLRQAYSGP